MARKRGAKPRLDGQEPDNEAYPAGRARIDCEVHVIKGRGGKSGERAVKAADLTSGGLRCVSATGLRPSQGDLTAAQKSAEGIVGGSAPSKARTVEAASRADFLARAMRQKDQIELNLGIGAEGEARSSAAQETEARAAKASPVLASRERIGPGKIALLEAIRKTGSIKAAAQSMQMSYRKAWLLLVGELNTLLVEPVVITAVGGAMGGSTTVTPVGEKAIALYHSIEAHTRAATRSEFRAFLKLTRG